MTQLKTAWYPDQCDTILTQAQPFNFFLVSAKLSLRIQKFKYLVMMIREAKEVEQKYSHVVISHANEKNFVEL